MKQIAILNNIVKELRNSNLDILNNENVLMINNIVSDILQSKEHSVDQITKMGLIVKISNIVYNNTDRQILPLEDGVYDLLLVLYKGYNPYYQVGAEPISFEASGNTSIMTDNETLISPAYFADPYKVKDSLFIADDLLPSPDIKYDDMLIDPIIFGSNISKRTINTPHVYPELVGTLEKCKFVLNSQAIDRGVFDQPSVQIFERDFIQQHLEMGIISPNEKFRMVAELKYDGVSVEAEVSDRVLSARSRGDTDNDIATDLTPILGGYRFRHAKDIPDSEAFGMKFEAIINTHNLYRLGELRQKEYKNCRNAIIGLFGASDAYLYRDMITLVPLATSLHLDRLVEIEFMNKYYRSGEQLRYAVLEGDYKEILFQVKRFVEEAEYMREFMPFMYDGVVLSYIDEDKKQALGRINSINQYSIAIKFDTMKKQTIFNGFTYTVGQNGTITPMIHYNPIEFYGQIHTKSSGHSYARFKELGLRIGDILDVEYTNDVMPYVTKPDNSANANNPNPIVEFITNCPSCGSILKVSDSGKSIICGNMECPERNISRMVNMLQKLNLKDFSEESLKAIARFSLSELFSLTRKDILFLGDVNSQKFIDRMTELRTNPIYDYKIMGALGFSGVAVEKWKLILNKLSIMDIAHMDDDLLKQTLVMIKGIGPTTADIIVTEREFFMKDINTILSMPNIISSMGATAGKSIRFSGIRDKELVELLNSKGYDANDSAGVTKNTDILIIPEYGYQSVKTAKAEANQHTIIVPIDEFRSDIEKYLD